LQIAAQRIAQLEDELRKARRDLELERLYHDVPSPGGHE
jgi:hypothetical protein